jgi:DHA1 family bicyclomycin/chloramphenicol resistance-like MFS transporter
MGALGTISVAVLTLFGSRYIAMPLIIGLTPFAVAMLLSARLLRPGTRAPKLES